MPKTVSQYRRLPYARRVQLILDDGNRYWHAWIDELPGCEVDGSSKAEAFLFLDEAFEDYIRAKLEWGSTIPEPKRWPKLSKRVRSKKSTATLKVLKRPVPPSPVLPSPVVDELARTSETLLVGA